MRLKAGVFAASVTALVLAVQAVQAAPKYTITRFTPVGTDTTGTGDGVSPSGVYATGYSQHSTPTPAGSFAVLFKTTNNSGTNLPALATPARAFNQPYAVNDSGVVVGRGVTSGLGFSPVPVIWQGGAASQLPFPSGYNAGRAYGINASGAVVGSIQGGSGFGERGFLYQNGVTTPLTATTANGATMTTAYGISAAGRIAGTANDPTNAALTHASYIDPGSGTLVILPDLPNQTTSIGFAISSNGIIGGSSGFTGQPFIYSEARGIVAVPLPPNASQGSVRGVNANGWAVGTAGGAFAVPFVYDGVNTYDLQTLINDPAWNINSNTSSGAFAIADNNTIVGRAMRNGVLTGFVLTLTGDYNSDGRVDAADYTVWADHFGQTGTPGSGLLGDGNADGVVDAADYTVWADNFGNGTAPAIGAVPEPTAAFLAAPAIALLARRRR